jgi:hypothetical protein
MEWKSKIAGKNFKTGAIEKISAVAFIEAMDGMT